MSYESGYELARKFCKIVGLDPDQCNAMRIEVIADCNSVAKMVVYFALTDDQAKMVADEVANVFPDLKVEVGGSGC